MNICKRTTTKGFTLIEVMVVVAIIVILLSIIMASILEARINTREKKRVADLANIEFAMTLYREKERNYPAFPSGVEVGLGGALDTVVAQYNGNTYTDPTSDGTGGSYVYWYDSSFTCTESGQVVLFAKTMEQTKNANFDEVCTSSSRDTTPASVNSYIVILKQ